MLDAVRVLIASPLEPEFVARIEPADLRGTSRPHRRRAGNS